MKLSYDTFKKLNNNDKINLMKTYNQQHSDLGYNKFTLNDDGTVTIRWIDKSTTTRRIEKIMCADFWEPTQQYDYIDYLYWRRQGCGDDEAMCRAMCD